MQTTLTIIKNLKGNVSFFGSYYTGKYRFCTTNYLDIKDPIKHINRRAPKKV
jgi:hypothetical protein